MTEGIVVSAPEGEEFWTAASDGRLLLKHCADCQRYFHYPRAFCPHCMSDRTEWAQASGKGTIYAFTVMRRGPDAGTVPAFVTLAEGPTMMAGIVGCAPEDVAIGAQVAVEFVPREDGQNIPLFKLEN